MTLLTSDTATHWAVIAPILSIRNEREYDQAVIRLNNLIDEVGDNERHALYGLLDTLGAVIHAYEQLHHKMPEAQGGQILQYLMQEHGLKQSDLLEIGSQGVVSEILNGKRELNTRQISALAERFGVSPAVFIPFGELSMAKKKVAKKKAAKKKVAKKKATKKKAKRKASKRELIDTGTDKRYVRRDAEGQFQESDDVGRSLSADRRRKAKTKSKSGQGDRGDR